MEKYFELLEGEVAKGYSVAQNARSKGHDPSESVEIPLAKNMAERVEGLISVVAPQIMGSGLSERILELEKKWGSQDWRISFVISEEVAKEKFCKFKDKHEAMEIALRVGLAYITNGVVASPLEGFIRLELKDRLDGQGQFFSLYFGGPIRSAGTTATCIFVAVCDYVRKKMGYAEYDPTPDEINRTFSELDFFHDRITNLQYMPSEEEVKFLSTHLPIQIEGDPSEKLDVPNYKGLDRVSTDVLRNGFCLVYAEGLAQKFAKFWGKFSKWYGEFDMDHWEFLEEFVKLQKKIKSKGKSVGNSGELIKPDYTYIKDLVAGRPILSHPMRSGGFRLRYGRARNTGLSSTAISPVTMKILEDYIGIGTQLKWERPSKGTALSSCDSIDGPIVKLDTGEVVYLTEDNIETHKKNIEKIIYLGDILVPYGDFYDRAHKLVPAGYCEEWWFKELESKSKTQEEICRLTGIENISIKNIFNNPLSAKISFRDALKLSETMGIPLHPRYIFFWNEVSIKEFLIFIDWLLHSAINVKESKIILPINYSTAECEIPKVILENLGIPHKITNNEFIMIEGDTAAALMANLGIDNNNMDFKKITQYASDKKEILNIINKFSFAKIKDKSGTFIGARMGRPEKAKLRKLTGSPHALFPVGEEGGRFKSFQAAMENGKITAAFPNYYCAKCDSDEIYPLCESCNSKTELKYFCPKCEKNIEGDICELHKNVENKYEKVKSYGVREINITNHLDNVKKRLSLPEFPSIIKGLRETTNQNHLSEHLSKGVLRAVHNLNVNKDGTIRYDMSEMSLTQFKPNEVYTPVAKLRELGYDKDIYGNELVDDNQILLLKPQDVVLPGCTGSPEEGADVAMFKIANFIDDLLVNFYGLKPYYNLKNKKDIIGHLIISLAPHTSAGIIGRIVGFSDTQGCYAHPLWHSAQRRDCDGDENGIMLMMDGFLNFSRHFLPAHRGATQDACLVLSSKLIPSEVDDMVFNMDVVWSYPLEFYEACEKFKEPYDIKIEQLKDNLGSPKEFTQYGYTHPVKNINSGVIYSAYKFLPTMGEKVKGQMSLACKIRAVDEDDVARLVIERHFLRDLKGNLRKFSMQQFRCVACNEKFRRPPLAGNCTACGGRLLFTISEGSVVKYWDKIVKLSDEYKLPVYSQQSIDILKKRLESVFMKDPEIQSALNEFM
ncbi:DNA polymerase II large subunit [Candidatus Woesearchaeota archaeon]|jgi:DNA polymerase II large subunit|nr:DNA polymerase II large subunit [Candidatus Woesearchaeota archaeon]MBT4835274.1 DNA polymerase II large subunit [Candidatus Woesearchaeota archaeon]MBT6734751.1 DNA polymerase II large subunit [Candidatus Woesearchaeota archaeon]MBT7474340.1 DNA polymerase II large subunit [Candidatus Woesearchaeota archaeon]